MANGNEYVVPFGVDSGPFFKGLNEMSEGTDKFKDAAAGATKELTEGFKTAATAGDKLVKVLDADTKELVKVRDSAKQVGKEVGEALSGKTVGNEFETKVKKFSDLLGKFGSEAKKPIPFNLDTAKLQEFENLIQKGANEFEILNAVIEHTKQVMAGLDPNSEEFANLAEQVALADGFLKEMYEAAEKVEGRSTSLVKQLRAMKQELAQMELAGRGNTEEFIQLSVAAGELEDQIGDVSARVRVLSSDTKYIDAAVGAMTALAGGFAAAQGAAALFGSENEEVQKVIEKVTGAMAVLQGIQAVAQALNKDSALSVLLFSRAQASAAVTTTALAGAEVAEAGAAGAAATAMEGFTAVLLANPITAVLVALTAIAVALVAFVGSSKSAKEATEDFNKSLEENSNLLSMDEAALKRRTDLQVAQAKRAGASESEILKIEGNAAIERLRLREQSLADLKKAYDDENNRRSLEPAALKKLGEDIIKTENEVADIRTEIQIKRLDVAKKQTDEQKELEKKRKEISDKALADAKKNAEERKKILEQQVKFAKDLRDLMAAGITDQFDKERAQAIAQTQDRIEDINKENGLSVKAIEDRKAIIIQLNKNLVTELAEIAKKELAERSKLEFEAQKTVADLQKDGLSKEIDLLKIGFEERRRAIAEQYKDEKAMRTFLIDQVNKAEEDAETKARNEGARKAQKNNEANQILQVETSAKFLSNFVGVEEAKNIAVLKVRLTYAEKYLKLLRDQGEDEKSTVVMEALKQVNELKKAVVEAVRTADIKGKTFSLRDLVFGKHNESDNEEIDKAVAASMQSISTLTDFVASQYQRQIDAKQKLIDADDKAVDKLEEQLKKEMDLRDEGLANNVDAIQAELDQKKAAREQDLKDQQELQDKQNAAKKAQLVIDSIAQASNLITAASEIFAALAGIPFIGVPLAITTIGLMTGAFIAAKVKAFQAVGDAQTFGEGGMIDGPSHSRGGKKYYASDGSGDVVEVEGGEFVTNKRSTKKYGDLLDAINNDEIAGMSDAALKGLLQGMGIHFEEEEAKEAVQLARSNEEMKAIVVIQDDKKELKNINQNISFLAERERLKVEKWSDDNFDYIKQGNKITKIKK